MQYRLRTAGVQPVYVEDALVWHYVPTDRCTVEWLRHRARRMGASRGHQRRQTGGIKLSSVAYVTLHFLRALAVRLANAGKAPEKRLASELDLIHHAANLREYFKG